MYFQLVRACVQPTGRKNGILVRFLREPPMRWRAVMATVAIWQREPDGRPLYHRERHTPGCDTMDVARRVAVRYLPASLRHDIVFKLSGDLIHSVVKLQAQVAETANPITFLDRAQPQWRDDLPLPVEDATVEALLRNLVRQARNLAQTERQRWRWRCYLAQRGESWSIDGGADSSTTTGRARARGQSSGTPWLSVPATGDCCPRLCPRHRHGARRSGVSQ